MPMRYLRMYSEMMPTLRAQEALRQVRIGAVAAGVMEQRAQREQIRSWQREAKIESSNAPPPKHLVAAMFGFRGIKVD